MRRKFYGLSLILILALTPGCHHAVAPVPGQLNTFDAYAYRVLADAQAAINDFKSSVTSGKLPETPTTKAALNQAITDYNLANIAYQAWHSGGGTGSTSTVNGPLNILQNDIATLPLKGGQ
jgi:hypothetical protein